VSCHACKSIAVVVIHVFGATHLWFLLPPRRCQLLQQWLPQGVTAAAATLACPDTAACCVFKAIIALIFILNNLQTLTNIAACTSTRFRQLLTHITNPTASVQIKMATAGQQAHIYNSSSC
jgi:hypothetical protein